MVKFADRAGQGTFTAQVNDIVQKTEKRMNAVIRQATQAVIDDAQTVGPSVASTKAAIEKGIGKGRRKSAQGPVMATGEGGRMRVDTGFLRASGQVSFTGMPTGPTRPAKDDETTGFKYKPNDTVLQLAKAKVGDTIYFGWTAEYAKYREFFDGFLAGAVQKFPQFVDKAVADVVKRVS